jgi:hypothetical protein
MLEVHCELMQQYLEATTEFWKGVLRWLEERERILARSSPLAK